MHWMRQQDKSRFLKFFIKITQVSHLINGNYLKRASPKAANIHNRWLSCRRQRSLRPYEWYKIVLEEGEHKGYIYISLMFALFEDVLFSCCETAGSVRFALFTSGYGYLPPSATLWQATKSSAATLAWARRGRTQAICPNIPYFCASRFFFNINFH